MDEKFQETNEVEKERTRNAVTLIVVIVIGLLIIVGLAIMLKAKLDRNEMALSNNVILNNNQNIQNVQGDKELQKVKVDFEELAKELYNKDHIHLLPELTTQERVSYEKEWNESLDEFIGECAKIIKKKYPTLTDEEVKKYAPQFAGYVKEDMFRVAKNNREIIKDAQDAVNAAELANAKSTMSLKYMEVMTDFHENHPGQSYKSNKQDLKLLQQHVLEKSDGKYTVKIKEDNSGYDVEKVAN